MKEYIVPIYDDSPNHDEIFVGYIRENATEIVRCKDCKHRDPEDKKCDCGMWNVPFSVNDDDFCSYGEKVTE